MRLLILGGLLAATSAVLAGEVRPGKSAPATISQSEWSPATPVVSVIPEPLTSESFKPFGEVIEVPATGAPTLENAVVRFWGGLAVARIHEEIEFGMYRIKTRHHELAELERHRRTPYLLVALDAREFLLAVAPPSVGGAGPLAAKVKVFTVRPGQAVLLAKDTWHALPFPKEDEGLCLVAFRVGTASKDVKSTAFRGREVVKF